jgi:hypothetical protein
VGTTARTGKHTVKPATGGCNGLVVVACDDNTENRNDDADELDGGFGGPCHDWLRLLIDYNNVPIFAVRRSCVSRFRMDSIALGVGVEGDC